MIVLGTSAQELYLSEKFARNSTDANDKNLMLLGFYDCHDTLERLDDYLDRELSPKENRQVAIHLAICLKCAQHYRFEQGFIQDVRAKLERVEVPPELMKQISLSLRALDAPE